MDWSLEITSVICVYGLWLGKNEHHQIILSLDLISGPKFNGFLAVQSNGDHRSDVKLECGWIIMKGKKGGWSLD